MSERTPLPCPVCGRPMSEILEETETDIPRWGGETVRTVVSDSLIGWECEEHGRP